MSKASNVFKPTVSQIKGDATTRAALAIIDADRAAQAAKTERLRAARLAMEADVRETARSQVDKLLTTQPGTDAQKAKRGDRVTQLPKAVRAKRKDLGIE